MLENSPYREGSVTEQIEDRIAAIPSSVFLIAAVAAMGISFGLKCFRKKHAALFVGQWVAPFLLLGIYNKQVKTSSQDQGIKY